MHLQISTAQQLQEMHVPVIKLHFVKINCKCVNGNLLTALLQKCLLHNNTYHEESVQWRRLVQVALEHHTVAAGCTKAQRGADWRGERHRVLIAGVKMLALLQCSTPQMFCFTFESHHEATAVQQPQTRAARVVD